MTILSSGPLYRLIQWHEQRDNADTRFLAKMRIIRYEGVEGGARDAHVTPEMYKVN